MKDACKLLTVLAEPTRLAVLRMLREGRKKDMTAFLLELPLSRAQLARHLGLLSAVELIVKEGDDAFSINPRLSPDIEEVLCAALALEKHIRRKPRALS